MNNNNTIPHIVGMIWGPGDEIELDKPYVPDFTQEFNGEFNSGMNGI